MAFTSYWRQAGLTYLQYINKCTTVARSVVKTDVAAKYTLREQFHIVKQVWVETKGGEKQLISNVATKL